MADRKIFNKKERQRIFNKFGNRCCNCGSSEDLIIHHIVPIAAGGTDDIGNLCLLCTNCHGATHSNLNNISCASHKSLGRKPILDGEEYKRIIHEFFFEKRGQMSVNELKEKLGFSKKTDLKQIKRFTEEMHNLNIKNYNIYVELMKKFNKPIGTVCGWILFDNGVFEDVYYS